MLRIISQNVSHDIHDTHPRDYYDLRKDGKLLFRGSEAECMKELHNIQSASIEHAMKYEGYTISRMQEDWRDYYQWYGGE